jgi:hypothetical protein
MKKAQGPSAVLALGLQVLTLRGGSAGAATVHHRTQLGATPRALTVSRFR